MVLKEMQQPELMYRELNRCPVCRSALYVRIQYPNGVGPDRRRVRSLKCTRASCGWDSQITPMVA